MPAAAWTQATVGISITPARTSVAAEVTFITVMPLIVEMPETPASRLTARPEINYKIVIGNSLPDTVDLSQSNRDTNAGNLTLLC
jgi:hypothetical protein